jgi:hypothetical protein
MDPLSSFIRDPSKQNEAWRNDGKYVCLICNYESEGWSKKCPSCRRGTLQGKPRKKIMLQKIKYFNTKMENIRRGCRRTMQVELFNKWLAMIGATHSTDGYRFLK